MKRKLLFAALLSCLIGGVKANAQTWTASKVEPGSFYIYNVGEAKFLTGGNSWGTHASLDAHGLYTTLVSATGGYHINTGNGRYLGADGYVDNGTAAVWTFESVDGQENIYKIKNASLGYMKATSGSTDLSFVADAPADSHGYWKLASRSALQTAANLSEATDESPVDVTFLMSGANFIRNCDGYVVNPGEKTNVTAGAWTYTIGGNNFTLSGPQAAGQSNTGCEMWNNTFDIRQTITVPNGYYYITCDGFGSANTRLYGNTVEASFTKTSTSHSNFSNTLANIGEYTEAAKTGVITVKDGQLTVGVKRSANSGSEWTVVDNIRIYCVGLYDPYQALEKALEAANAVKDEPMNADVKTTLNAAISSAANLTEESASDDIESATEALTTATITAQASADAYASAKGYIDTMGSYLEGTNVYTTTAYNTWYGNVKSGYENGALTTDEAAEYTASKVIGSGWHQNSGVGNIDNILLSTWKIGDAQCNKFDTGLYINNWSVEGNSDGSEFYTPFFEYWTGDANSLGANTLVSKVTGLTPLTDYSFTIRARVRQTNDQTKIANGITMQVGSGTAVDISAGAQFNGGQFYIGNFSAMGQTDESGTLTTTITIAENSNISWLSFYNCMVSEGEDLSSYIADYEFALNNANTALTNDTQYTSFQSALSTAATTYASVDRTDKSALIAAKEALESALTAYNAAVSPLKGTILTGWTRTGNTANFEVNTWSGEGNTDGSGMTTPFAQNWQAKGNGSLGDATMSYTLSDLTPGYYRVTALVRSLYELGGATPAGTFIFANENLERAFGANAAACTNGVYGKPVVYGLVGEDGKLTVGFKIIKATVNWLSWKNISLEYVGTTLTSEIAENQKEEVRTFAYNTTAQTTENEAVSALATLNDANYTAAGVAIENAYKALDRDFTALQAALTAKADAVLGFEAGEYAPYNLVAPLAAANAIDQTSEANTQDEINTATTNLNNVTANAAEVNAIYGGDFTKYETVNGQDLPYGWNLYNTGNNSRIMGGTEGTENTGLSATTSGKALLIKFNATYGEADGYTLPLKAGKIYKITFKYGGWGNTPNTIVSLTDPNDATITLTPNFKPTHSDANSDKTHWDEYTGYFAATATGNYKLNFNKVESGQQQIVIADIDLRTADAIEFADGSVPTYAPGTYPNVKITRSLSAGKWATAVYPFAVSDVDKIAKLDSYKDETLGFTSATESEANVPFLMRSETDKAEITLSNVAVAAAVATDAEAGDAKLVGTYSTVSKSGADGTLYVLSANTIYPLGEAAATINPYRAYIAIETTGEAPRRLRFVVDGQTTAIEGIEQAGAERLTDGQAYDLSGRAVRQLSKGMYIVNGKKVLVK